MLLETDTIFALSTPDIASAICVFRISGSNSLKIAKILTQKSQVYPDKIYYRHIYDPTNDELIDSGIIFYKKNPHSFTGEDSLEIQLHGARAIIKRFTSTLENMDLCRHAAAGEFTKRAFLNGKIDIFQAEALSDLIHSQTDYQRRLAQEGMSGTFSKFITNLRHDIIKLNAFSHAMIDFADDEVPESTENMLINTIEAQISGLSRFIDHTYQAHEIKKGLKIAIIGAPNVGKSSFVNNILGRNAVIVSEIAGTTRDILEFNVDIQGYPIIFYDTAGLRKTDCPIEAQGIALAYEKMEEADLIFHLQDPNQSLEDDLLNKINVFSDKIHTIYTKKDIYHNISHKNTTSFFYISNLTVSSLDNIFTYISLYFKYTYDNQEKTPLLNQRYMYHLIQILNNFKNSLINIKNNNFFLFSEDLKIIQYEIELMTGNISTDDLLDQIFSTFCIGK